MNMEKRERVPRANYLRRGEILTTTNKPTKFGINTIGYEKPHQITVMAKLFKIHVNSLFISSSTCFIKVERRKTPIQN